MQLKHSEIKPFRLALLEKQGGLCAICTHPIAEGKACLDHDHKTGAIRGVVHRNCNSVLGRVENGHRYGKEFDPVAFAKGLHSYLTKEQTMPLHPLHKVKNVRK